MCRTVDLREAVLAKNDDLAEDLRQDLTRRGITVVNLLSSPGSGKTALLEHTLAGAASRDVPVAALTADLATENDAARLSRARVPVKQVLTGGLCHLEARQLRGHVDSWLPEGPRLLFVENVGNLVCPASYDLGETLRVTLMSVTEGEDKPLKYPTAFGLAHLVVLTKYDIAEAVDFRETAFLENVAQVNPGVEVLRTSSRNGMGVDQLWQRLLEVHRGGAVHRPPLAGELLRAHAHDHGPDEHEHHHHHEHDPHEHSHQHQPLAARGE
ncbi:hydrogenase nickel incorporation protein HypB [Streptomyces sp. NPDC005438]|uniref:hydrogenase nickel incorporation protein HypB n=1 Tax=Streptomyces sp. NPDC005438 TaxID=3156880 RepID=UPI0033AC0FF8